MNKTLYKFPYLPDKRIEVNIEVLESWINKMSELKEEPKSLDEVLIKWPDAEVIKYISYYFGYWTEQNKKAELQRIRGLDLDTIILAIARMKEIEESQDNSKIIPGVSAGIVLLVNQVSGYYKDSNDPFWEGVSSLILAFGVYVFLLFVTKRGSEHRSKAIKYRSLLEQVKSEMEKK
ncbi:hypothetical protein QNK06_11475 [Bacillus subtilis]|uniref:hypothetical protein n=1 Tax=Bacillus subtilis TaxID=1423 RepID=UPI0024C1C18F|nr:hypothetical protein [Bacillus subtilis]WHY07615.1 hypothetical protein QNK06_11475 [Bacillus subtilis]